MKQKISEIVERFKPVGIELIHIRAEDVSERIRHELKVETERLRWEALMEEQLCELRREIACKAQAV